MGAADRKIIFADWLRGVACLCVAVIHFWGPLWTNPKITSDLINSPVPEHVGDLPAVHAAIRYIPNFDLGALGVGMFFLISGFVIPISLERYSRGGFLAARAWRIVPTYAVCFSVTLAVIIVTGLVFERPYPYTWGHTLLHFVPGPRFLASTTLIDPVIWTLEIEVVFYALCAAVAPYIRRGDARVFLVPLLMLGLLVLATELDVPGKTLLNIVPYLIYMFAGMAFYYHWRGFSRSSAALAIALALLVAADISLQIVMRLPVIGLMRVSYGAAFLVFLACYVMRDRFQHNPAIAGLALISYPFYAVHEISGYAIQRALFELEWQADVICVAALLVTVLLSIPIHRLVERPTQAAGRRWANAITHRDAAERDPRPAPAPRRQRGMVVARRGRHVSSATVQASGRTRGPRRSSPVPVYREPRVLLLAATVAATTFVAVLAIL